MIPIKLENGRSIPSKLADFSEKVAYNTAWPIDSFIRLEHSIKNMAMQFSKSVLLSTWAPVGGQGALAPPRILSEKRATAQ